MIVLLLFITGALFTITGIMFSNVLFFPRLRAAQPPNTPLVSVLLPARNEAHIIAQTIQALLAQDYPNYEVLLLDDASEDGTADIAQRAGCNDGRLRVLEGKPLPPGWIGKNWACHQLSQHANGEILLFTDADVQWQPEALSAVMAQMQRRKADMFTVWPTQRTVTMAERLTVPLVAYVVMGYLPILLVHHAPSSLIAGANGQCMAWKREAYGTLDGHQSVADNVLEDVTLARLAKKAGLRIRMADGAGLLQTRMYDSWQSVRNGYAKNILVGYGSVGGLLLGALFHWLLFWLPWALLLVPQVRLWAALLIVLGIGTRMLSAQFTGQRMVDALLMPVSVLLMTIISAQSIYWHVTKRARWKGRTL